MTAVLAAAEWPTNAELIADVARLGYLRDTDHVLDPTYELGVWWQQWRPEKLTAHYRAQDGSDFRHLPHPDGAFDAVAFDPPYVCPGGRKTSTIKAMHRRYGMAEGGYEDPDFRTPDQLQAIINDGLTEMHRLVRRSQFKKMHRNAPNGIVLVKCKDYIWSGQYFPGAHNTLAHALSLGFVLEDRFEFIGDPGPQPTVNPDGTPREQKHARRNHSTLLVLRKPTPSKRGQPRPSLDGNRTSPHRHTHPVPIPQPETLLAAAPAVEVTVE